MIKTDLSGGLPIEREMIVAERPDEPFWCENLLFALYDPDIDIGFWLHLGSVPTEWAMWEDLVFGCFPGEDIFSTWGYYYTPQEKKPAGSNLAAKCIEPFKRWKVTFDGFVKHTTDAEMQAGLAPDGMRKRMIIDLDIECAVPVWDAHISSRSRGGKGEMTNQGWAKEC
ncbi:hypothetical protein [Rhizorhapis sp. SPR117]|uniref:hypothetical protein n=1 Tax=Rhizorhapis sp. SPR117 TaxID=2912611 RepID=UPI001F308754|nr:hypothetical protein [Rhizorhapis sp. SPR117]